MRPHSGRNGEGKRGRGADEAPAMARVEGEGGAALRAAGNAGWAGVYSFNGNKIITSSGGGALVSGDEGVVQRANRRSQQNREAALWYEHREVGYNYRMSNIVAAIGLGQLMHLDRIIAKKRRIFDSYRKLLGDVGGLSFMPEADYGRCTRWLTVLQLEGEDHESRGNAPCGEVLRVIRALEAENIESRPVWKPMHLQPVFAGCRVYGPEIDERIFTNGLCLPSGAGLADADLERVAGIVKDNLF